MIAPFTSTLHTASLVGGAGWDVTVPALTDVLLPTVHSRI